MGRVVTAKPLVDVFFPGWRGDMKRRVWRRGLLDYPLRKIVDWGCASCEGNPNTKPGLWSVTLSCGHIVTMTGSEWERDGRGKWLTERKAMRCEDCGTIERKANA